MSSDVRLDGDKVILESNKATLILEEPLLKAKNVWDFWLSHPARLNSGTDPNVRRAALIHLSGDCLGINALADYSGGVSIGGNVSIKGDIKIRDKVIPDTGLLKCEATDIILDHPFRRLNTQGLRRALVHDKQDTLSINYAGDYPGGVKIFGDIQIHKLKSHAVFSDYLIGPGEGGHITGTFSQEKEIDLIVEGGTIKRSIKITTAGQKFADTTIDLFDEISLLRNEMDTLKAEIVKLQAKIGP